MARPKRGEPGHEQAMRRWKETMEARYGSASGFMAEIGKKGGSKTGVCKGFAADNERAKRAGAKGGKISKRGPAKKGKENEEK